MSLCIVAEYVAHKVTLLQYVTTTEESANIFTNSALGLAFKFSLRCHRDFMVQSYLPDSALFAVLSLSLQKKRLLIFSKLVCICKHLFWLCGEYMLIMQMNTLQHMSSMLLDEIKHIGKQRKNLVERLIAKGIQTVCQWFNKSRLACYSSGSGV
jgi:hypothetical protein